MISVTFPIQQRYISQFCIRKIVGKFAKLSHSPLAMREQTIFDSLKKSLWPTSVSIVVLTLTGPFGTYQEFALLKRFEFWSLSILGGSFFIHLIVFYLVQRTDGGYKQKLIASISGSILGSIPATLLVVLVYVSMTGVVVPTKLYLSIWGNVVVVAVLIAILHVLPGIFLRPKLPNDEEPVASEDQVITSDAIEHVPLLELLPDGTRPCQIMSFSMQDHYVEIRTVDGVSLHLMTLREAIEQLGDLKGARVHRSHWVSYRHITDVQKDGRRHAAILTDERKIPVSGSYLEDARALLEAKNAAP